MEREKFYVTLDQSMLTLSDIKVDDNTIQYEVLVTPEERHKLESTLIAIQNHDLEGGDVLTFFNERKADRDKEATENEIGSLYALLQQYGTKETKDLLAELKK
ncbi:hypothetical protein [Geomicrobium sp. JCM 19039]|uniref:hypothetical protein n=1 Tax=Geomicrobium sp. JCM 19039 TaxID=1460636 RepID=UPI00045F24C0|nr:hypothetical protein [Geomicrobium sp. JCM 19039]GAK13469.1 hypothetical protein JCM19039_3318 [Geomicrobium sp. JCM 19039]